MKQEKVKVIIEKVGRIWIQAKDVRYNNKAVKIEINENFNKEMAKESIGKEIELDCNIDFIRKYTSGYDVIMYPINLKEVQAKQKAKEYQELKNKIFNSINKWTKEKAAEGIFYVSKFVRENLNKLEKEDKETAEILITQYEKESKRKAEKETFYYIEDFSNYDDIKKLEKGTIVRHITGKYGVVIKASRSYKVSQADVEDGFHAWGTEYATETLCEVLSEDDARVKEFIANETKEIVEENKIEKDDFLKTFAEEFSIENKVEFSQEEKEIMKNEKIKLTGEEVWEIEKINGFGKVFIIEENYIWYITNNTGDGDNWDLNFIESETSEGYGYKLLKTEKRIALIERFKKLKKAF